MDKQALQRLRRAQRRVEILKRVVRWWGKASAAQKVAVLAEVRAAWPLDTLTGAVECNAYDDAGSYLSVNGWVKRCESYVLRPAV
jgi:hypothetical protein